MARDYRFNDRLDFAMGIMTFTGAGVAVLVPLFLIVSSIFISIPFLNQFVIAAK